MLGDGLRARAMIGVMGWVKKALVGVAILVGAAALGVGGFVGYSALTFNRSVARVYEVAAPDQLVARDDVEVIARGRHLAESLGSCLECHGENLGGKPMDDLGPLGRYYCPNLTKGAGGVGARYTDGQLIRAVRDGIKADGTTLLLMPCSDFNWWPDDDYVALVSYIRAQPPVDGELPPSEVGLLGKVLDRLDMLELDVARRLDHDGPRPEAPAPAPTAEYGRFVAKLCVGCHGAGYSGGPIPGAPSSLPVPTNITQHESGLLGWTEDDFFRLLNEGARPDGTKLDPFMPTRATSAMNELEKRALWAYLSSVPPRPFGER